MAGTRFNKAITIGAALTVLASLASNVMLFIGGQVQVQGDIRTVGQSATLTQTGSTTTVVVSRATAIKAVTATGATAAAGANGVYPTFRWQNPTTQTASVLNFCLDIYTTPSPATTTNCYVNNESTTGSGGARYFFKATTLTRGHLCYRPLQAQSGAYLPQATVGPDEHIKCSNSLGAGSGQGLTGDGFVEYYTRRL